MVSAKMLATCLHLMQGTPYIYQGEELGMTNVQFDSIEDYRDIETMNMYREKVEKEGVDPTEVMRSIHKKSRDNARTPMQWDDSANGGFTSGTPWIRVNPNYPEINAAQAVKDPDSVFHYYRRLIQLRKKYPIMVYGIYDLILEDHEQIYAYTRSFKGEQWLVICNFSGEEADFQMPAEVEMTRQELIIANLEVDPTENISSFTLKPYEARVYQIR